MPIALLFTTITVQNYRASGLVRWPKPVVVPFSASLKSGHSDKVADSQKAKLEPLNELPMDSNHISRSNPTAVALQSKFLRLVHLRERLILIVRYSQSRDAGAFGAIKRTSC